MQKVYDKAIADYNKVIEITPKFADVYYNKALLCEKLKKIREAIKAYGDFLTYADGENKDIQIAKKKIAKLSKKVIT